MIDGYVLISLKIWASSKIEVKSSSTSWYINFFSLLDYFKIYVFNNKKLLYN